MSKKILVVEDQLVTLTILQTLLEAANFDVVTTSEGTKVKQLVVQHQPDIVILDIMMPEKDGIENIRELRSMAPELLLVAISSNEIYLSCAEKLGANYCYKKPIMGTSFVNFITSII
jgi:DNA-binding response OmpR family regulator